MKRLIASSDKRAQQFVKQEIFSFSGKIGLLRTAISKEDNIKLIEAFTKILDSLNQFAGQDFITYTQKVLAEIYKAPNKENKMIIADRYNKDWVAYYKKTFQKRDVVMDHWKKQQKK